MTSGWIDHNCDFSTGLEPVEWSTVLLSEGIPGGFVCPQVLSFLKFFAHKTWHLLFQEVETPAPGPYCTLSCNKRRPLSLGRGLHSQLVGHYRRAVSTKYPISYCLNLRLVLTGNSRGGQIQRNSSLTQTYAVEDTVAKLKHTNAMADTVALKLTHTNAVADTVAIHSVGSSL